MSDPNYCEAVVSDNRKAVHLLTYEHCEGKTVLTPHDARCLAAELTKAADDALAAAAPPEGEDATVQGLAKIIGRGRSGEWDTNHSIAEAILARYRVTRKDSP